MNKTTCLLIIFQPRAVPARFRWKGNVQRVLEDAFKTRIQSFFFFSFFFFRFLLNFGVVPNNSTQGKLNHIKHT